MVPAINPTRSQGWTLDLKTDHINMLGSKGCTAKWSWLQPFNWDNMRLQTQPHVNLASRCHDHGKAPSSTQAAFSFWILVKWRLALLDVCYGLWTYYRDEGFRKHNEYCKLFSNHTIKNKSWRPSPDLCFVLGNSGAPRGWNGQNRIMQHVTKTDTISNHLCPRWILVFHD